MRKLFRPRNIIEQEIFIGEWCDNCVYDDIRNEEYCSIRNASFVYWIGDPKYPRELIYDDDGVPMCTKFKPCG